uniref:Uncharacterized protein n=1 Tax=Anguilla anguilla TaxID=7936 RepID=A0A0E9REJ2_ANGAN
MCTLTTLFDYESKIYILDSEPNQGLPNVCPKHYGAHRILYIYM